MNRLKTQKLWFLVLNISIFLSFACFTVSSQFKQPSQIYAEDIAEKTTESDEKSSEKLSHFYLHELPLELSLTINSSSPKNVVSTKFTLPMFWPSPSTPPPDLS